MKAVMKMSLLALSAFAQDEEDGPELRKFNRLNEMLTRTVTTNIAQRTFRLMLENYGCHCFPGRGNNGAAGPAMDGYDKLCRDLNRCYKCLGVDHGSSFGFWHNYRWHYVNNEIVCTDNRNSQAMQDLCNCDAQYAVGLGAIWDDNTYNYTIWRNARNSQQNFDHTNTCVRSQGIETNACCGTYPFRRPFNDDLFDCCDDGQVRDSCV